MLTEYYDLFRLLQTTTLNVGVVVCAVFLWQYRRSWNLRDKFSRFVVGLNLTYIFVVLSVTAGRLLFPDSALVELVKFVVFTILVVVMASQLHLRRNGDR